MHRLSHLRIHHWLGYLLLGLLLPIVFGMANAQTEPKSPETPAQEVIQNYESDILIRKDGRLEVTERITVINTESEQITGGIYRYFPNPEFKIKSVKRNGNPTTYRTEVEDGRKRIEIWKKDVYIGRGTYTYQIQYVTDRQIENQGGQDRLYWNVTGQSWAFPIKQVKANIELPAGIASSEVDMKGFVGETGEKGQSYEASLKQDGDTVDAVFATTRSLQEREGLSVIVDFPQGYIESPTLLEQLTSNSRTIFLSLLGIAAIGLSYFSYRQARQVARNRPIYLNPGEQSRVKVGLGRSRNSDSVVFAWVFIGSSLATLAIALFLSMGIADISIFVSVIGVILPIAIVFIFGLFLASLLDEKFSNLRPRLDANEHCSMKSMDSQTVKSHLSEPEKQTAWELGSIEVEGWYSPENPSAIHLRIYDFPRGPRRYRCCPTCQEYIVYVADIRVVKEATTRYEGTRLNTCKCHCCD